MSVIELYPIEHRAPTLEERVAQLEHDNYELRCWALKATRHLNRPWWRREWYMLCFYGSIVAGYLFLAGCEMYRNFSR